MIKTLQELNQEFSELIASSAPEANGSDEYKSEDTSKDKPHDKSVDKSGDKSHNKSVDRSKGKLEDKSKDKSEDKAKYKSDDKLMNKSEASKDTDRYTSIINTYRGEEKVKSVRVTERIQEADRWSTQGMAQTETQNSNLELIKGNRQESALAASQKTAYAGPQSLAQSAILGTNEEAGNNKELNKELNEKLNEKMFETLFSPTQELKPLTSEHSESNADNPFQNAGHAEQIFRAPVRTTKSNGMGVVKDLLFLVLKIAALVLIFVLLFTFLFGVMKSKDLSMDPSIKDGDLVFFYRSVKSGYMPRDTVIVDIQGQKQIRRVVATEGDLVDVTEGNLIINGAIQQETDIYQMTDRYTGEIEFPLIVPDGQVFVLGDNRINATDSRIYGCVKIDDTRGKVMAVIRRRSI